MVADFREHINGDWVIVFERDVVLGYTVLLIGESSVLLDNIAVDVGTQRQGVGKALVERIEDHVLELGLVEYDLYTNVLMTENIHWYQKLGFAETKRIEENGFSRVYMRKQLNLKP